MFDFGEKKEKKRKRTLGIRDKQILLERAKYKCEACEKEIKFSEMQVGHKRAYAKGGSTTLRNSVCLCYSCNKLQGTDSWQTFQRKRTKKKNKKEPKKRKTTREKKASTKKAPSSKEKKTTKKTSKKKKSKEKSLFDQIWEPFS